MIPQVQKYQTIKRGFMGDLLRGKKKKYKLNNHKLTNYGNV